MKQDQEQWEKQKNGKKSSTTKVTTTLGKMYKPIASQTTQNFSQNQFVMLEP